VNLIHQSTGGSAFEVCENSFSSDIILFEKTEEIQHA